MTPLRLVAPLRCWKAHPVRLARLVRLARPGRPARRRRPRARPFYDPLFADPRAVEDDYARMSHPRNQAPPSRP